MLKDGVDITGGKVNEFIIRLRVRLWFYLIRLLIFYNLIIQNSNKYGSAKANFATVL